MSAVADSDSYKSALQKVGFNILAERNRRDFALTFFADLRAKTAAAGCPPPLGLHVLMGKSTPEHVQNMIDNICKGRMAPVELMSASSEAASGFWQPSVSALVHHCDAWNRGTADTI